LQIINHGVSDESLSNMKQQVEGFFDLPLQEKKRWAQKPGSLEGYGQAFVTTGEQKLEWNDMIFLRSIHPLQNRNLDFWPENPPEFR
jgi:isopenicillin N synthase-like dioxygenase